MALAVRDVDRARRDRRGPIALTSPPGSLSRNSAKLTLRRWLLELLHRNVGFAAEAHGGATARPPTARPATATPRRPQFAIHPQPRPPALPGAPICRRSALNGRVTTSVNTKGISNVRNTIHRRRHHHHRPDRRRGRRSGGLSSSGWPAIRGGAPPRATGNPATRCTSRSTAGASSSPGVGASLGKGAPVIVVGYVYTSEYEDRDGVRRSSLEDAGHLGGTGSGAQHRDIEQPAGHGREQRRCRRDAESDESAGEAEATGSDDDGVGREGVADRRHERDRAADGARRRTADACHRLGWFASNT